MIRIEETTKRSQNERCLSFATSMPPQNFIKSSFHRYSRKREMLVADKAFWQTPQRSFCNYVTKPARPFISPTRYCETHPFTPIFSHLIIDLRTMCVWSGQGGRNCREDLLAGGQPPIRPNGGEKPEFPAAGHETALRSPFDRWLCGCSSSLYTP